GLGMRAEKGGDGGGGLLGGGAGGPAKYILNPDAAEARELPSKITFQLAPGDVVSVQTPGGGGTAGALERDPERVAADAAQGKISAERARAVYGVVVDPLSYALDAAATAPTRAQLRPSTPPHPALSPCGGEGVRPIPSPPRGERAG